MEGTELLALLRETKMDVKVIVISTNIQGTVRDQCMNLGVSEFFSKPPDKEKLKEAIEKLLNSRRTGLVIAPTDDQLDILREIVNIGIGKGGQYT